MLSMAEKQNNLQGLQSAIHLRSENINMQTKVDEYPKTQTEFGKGGGNKGPPVD